jgi:2-dehydro-3-deoxyphosphogluconate aldolase/(4S)-4-hydroxy-2-oxoglutarate aldolase
VTRELTRDHTAEKLKTDGLVAIIRGDFSLAEQRTIAEALSEGGVRALEVTLNTKDALEGVAQLRRDFSDLLVGAGTVRTATQARAALAAGAQFLIAPCFDRETVSVAHDAGTLILPGIFTATEAQTAFRAGCTMLKLFPADALGPKYLKALRAPLDDIDFVPTGGVDPETIGAFHAAGAAAFGIGSYLVKNGRVTDAEAAALASRARKLREALEQARGT